MSQRRIGVILGGVVLAVAAVSVPAYAQGPQRGNRGGPGGGGPGGFRGGFGRGGSLVDLATREPVQKEIQVTEEQKPKIEQLARDSRSQRERAMRQLRQRNDRARSQVRAARPNIPQVDPNAGNPGGGFGNDFGGYGTSPYGNVPNQGPTPAQLQQMAEMQQRQQERMVRAQGSEQMRQAMEGLQRQTDQSLAKILKKEQMTRLRQIQLQMEGPFAVLSNAELGQILQITPEQNVRLRDVQARDRQMRGQVGQERRAIFETIRDAMQTNAAPGGQPNAQQAGERGGRGNFDREAFREAMQRPEVQAQFDKIQQQEDTLRDRAYAGVFKELDRRQASTYKKLLGEPFDTNALRRGFFTDRSDDDQADERSPEEDEEAAEARSKALVDDTDDADAGAPAAKEEAKPAPTTAPAPAPANRPTSLRERRGLGSARP